jgi:hypothetical protein
LSVLAQAFLCARPAANSYFFDSLWHPYLLGSRHFLFIFSGLWTAVQACLTATFSAGLLTRRE